MAEFILGFILFGVPAIFIAAFIIVKNKCEHDYRMVGRGLTGNGFLWRCNKCRKMIYRDYY